MKLRNKLLLPTLATVLIGFSAFVFIYSAVQNKNAVSETQFEMDNLTDLIVTANMSYVWNYDTIGLQQSLDSFLKNEDIVRIEMFDNSGLSMAAAAEQGEAPDNLFEREVEIIRDSVPIGKTNITFTDYYIRSEKSSVIRLIIIIVTLVFVAVAIVMSLISRYVTRPVNRLTLIVKDMAEGDANLAARIPVKGNDELSELSDYFNTFLEKLRTIVVNLKNVGSGSRKLSSDLAGNSMSVSGSSLEISAAIHQISEQINHLKDEVVSCNVNTSKIHSFIARVVDMIQEQAAGVNESSAAIEQMIANVANIESSTTSKLSLVNHLVEKTRALEDDAAGSAKAMEETWKSTELISEMIVVINNVASQTNLLAMNAAIEAAHAGDYGRGFAVVADEIRKLAEQTTENARRIGDTLEEVIIGIQEAAEMTQSSSASIGEVISGIEDMNNGMNETMAGLKELSIGSGQITDSLTSLTRITEEVRTSGEGMREGTDLIESSMNKISGIITENKTGIDDIARAISEITQAIAVLSDLSDRNSMNIKTLDMEIEKFSI